MLKFDYAEYAASEEAVTAARPAAERTAKAIWEKGFSNIFLTAVGGSLSPMMAVGEIAKQVTDAYYPKGHIPKPAEPQHLRENNRRPTPGPLFFHTCKRPTADRSKNPMARRPSKRRQFPRVPASPISPA